MLSTPPAPSPRLSAEWLRAQPGVDRGGFYFVLLTQEQEPITDWPGLNVMEHGSSGTPEFELSLGEGAADDYYLYVAYPDAAYCYDGFKVSEAHEAEWIALAVPRRTPGVLVLGLSRVGASRDKTNIAGSLATLRFATGAEHTFRSVSAVNTDANSAPGLSISGQGASSVELSWEERNIGDYNNNGEVEIADITPVGMYFGQLVDDAADPAALVLVDGDENGEINISDLTPIGRNFARTTGGFNVFMAYGASPSAEDFSPIAEPSITRSEVWDAADSIGRSHRLQYIYTASTQVGWNHYYVAAYGRDDPTGELGPASNTVAHQALPTNLPPVWDSVEGINSVVGLTNGLRITFGRATDPEGSAVSYSLYYNLAGNPIFGPGSVSIDVTAAVVGDPPYTYEPAGLTPGESYSLLIRAEDEDGMQTQNLNLIEAIVPQLRVSNDPWPSFRGNPGHSGANPALNVSGTLVENWQANLNVGSFELTASEPVISADGWVAVFAASTSLGDALTLRKYDLASGELLSEHPAPFAFPVAPDDDVRAFPAARPALDGDTLVVGTSVGVAVYNLATTDPPVMYDTGGEVYAAPLLLGDYVFYADTQGSVHALLWKQGATVWTWPETGGPGDNPPISMAPCADSQFLYVVDTEGHLTKLRLGSGEVAAQSNLTALPVGDALELDTGTGRLYLGTADDMLVELDSSDLSVVRNWPSDAGYKASGNPLLLTHNSPPLVLAGRYLTVGLEPPSQLKALNMNDASEVWDNYFMYPTNVELLAGSATRTYHANSDLIVSDFDGNERQRLPLNAAPSSSCFSYPTLDTDYLAIVWRGWLSVFETSAINPPPAWIGTEGIRALGYSGSDVAAEWDYAEDELGQSVYYFVLINEDAPPDFEIPGNNTQFITVPHSDLTHSLGLTELLADHRYYVSVRAGDSPDYDSARIESDKTYLAITPPWEREDLVLGDDLPTGRIQSLRGVIDPAGAMHLVYNDAANGGALNHIWHDGAAWQHEGANLNSFPAQAIYPTWDLGRDQLAIAYAYAPWVAVVRRTGPDTWANSVVPIAVAATNPQLGLAPGAEYTIAYTEHIAGSFPSIEEYIYTVATDAGAWQPVLLLDDMNYAGRDIAMRLTQFDEPLLAYQRGTHQAINRLTPRIGQLMYGVDDGAGSFTLTEVDAGVNSPDSDCGKRVRLVLNATGNPHLAYYDLNASPDDPLGQLKHAWHDGAQWNTEVLHGYDLSFQADINASMQFTAPELGLQLTAVGVPVIAELQRLSASNSSSDPHNAVPIVWVRDAVPTDPFYPWRRIPISDVAMVFNSDREPLELLITPDGVWHVFFVTTQLDSDPWQPDTIVHLSRPVL